MLDNVRKPEFGLRHVPVGAAHPYKREPYERFPRYPQANEPVSLGVCTWPPKSCEHVWVEWGVDLDPGRNRTEGIHEGSHEGQDQWIIEFPATHRRQHVNYQIYASSGDHIRQTESFGYFTSDWYPVGEIIGAWRRTDSLLVICGLQGLQLQAAFNYQILDPDLIKLEILFSHEIPAPQDRSFESINTKEPALRHGALEVIVTQQPTITSIIRSKKPLLSEFAPMEILLGEDDEVLKLRQHFQTQEDEAFFGFGERFNTLNQRGETLDVRVYEQYKQQGKRTYYPVPFFLSSQGYALHLDTAQYVAYDLAASQEECWSFTVDLDGKEKLDTFLFTDPDPLRRISKFTDLTGSPEVPPRWAFGLWMSGNEWNSQAEVLRQFELTLEHEIPASVLVIEAWSDEATFYIWNDTEYAPRPAGEALSYDDFSFPPEGRWPDPKKMINKLHENGLRIVLWQIPVHKTLDFPHAQQDLDRTYMIEKGFGILESSGEPYRVRPFWFHNGLLWDVTNPAAVDWWLSKRAYLLDELGVDGFKTDGGEHLWGYELRSHSLNGDELINQYPLLYIKAYHEFANQHRDGDAITFSRAGFTGAGAFPAHWAGDEDSTWDAFRASILAGLSIGMSGVPFWGWDIAGFSGEIPSAELYLRSTAMSVFCPIMQYHSEFNDHRSPKIDRTPWNIQDRTKNERVIPVFRKFANLRMNMLPWITHEAHRSAETGIPMMRALPLVYSKDRRARDFPHEYLFGDDLFVAPVVEEGVERWKVYLPEGRWFGLWEGDPYDGPLLIEVDAPIDRIPVFIRSGAILPLNLGSGFTLGESVGNNVDEFRNLCFLIHADEDASCAWFDSLSGHIYPITVTRNDDRIEIRIPPIPYPTTLMIREQRPEKIALNGEELVEADPRGDEAIPSWNFRGDRESVVRLPKTSKSQQVSISFIS